MVKKRIFGERAIYQNREYEFQSGENNICMLISHDPKDMEDGFVQVDENRYIKRVRLEELESAFDLDTAVIYKGDQFRGNVIEDDKIMLYTANEKLYEKYCMNMIDRAQYWMYVNIDDVDSITETRTPLPKYMRKQENAGKFAVDKNRVTVHGRSVAFNRDIVEYLLYEDTLIVLLNIMDKTEYENLYCVDANAKVIWRIQDVREALPDLTEQSSIFGLLEFPNSVFTYSDCLGRSFKFDPKTGKIIRKYGA
jgi:hypothetical protein